MQLPEGAGKRGFAALVRTGYDQYPFPAPEVKAVAHDRRALGNKLVGERDVESIMIMDFRSLVRNSEDNRTAAERVKDTMCCRYAM